MCSISNRTSKKWIASERVKKKTLYLLKQKKIISHWFSCRSCDDDQEISEGMKVFLGENYREKQHFVSDHKFCMNVRC